MTKKYTLLLLVLWGSAFISAQEYQQLNIRFLPPDYYVGDTVELQFTLRSSGNLNLLPPETLPDPGWVKLLSFKIEYSGSDQIITIRFIPYYSGTRTLPPLALGDLTLRDIKIYTSSVLRSDGERELSGIRHNLLIPGTRVIGALIFSALLSLPLLFLFLFKIIRRHTGVLIRTYRLNLPYRKFIRLLKRIRQTLGNMSDKDFFSIYSGGLKNYLSTRFHLDFSALTTSEMEMVFRSSSVAEPLYLTLLNLFHRMDRVKFAGEELTSLEREGMLLEAEQISGELETWRKSHADF
ncbi:MAG: hypothetical protein B6241_12130 [Spirochaetaceae bacterium 4572_59]|nr:MAG: hypothetical protein B6241_12130 [Spirochaetaceae bacterium 4572_59]